MEMNLRLALLIAAASATIVALVTTRTSLFSDSDTQSHLPKQAASHGTPATSVRGTTGAAEVAASQFDPVVDDLQRSEFSASSGIELYRRAITSRDRQEIERGLIAATRCLEVHGGSIQENLAGEVNTSPRHAAARKILVNFCRGFEAERNLTAGIEALAATGVSVGSGYADALMVVSKRKRDSTYDPWSDPALCRAVLSAKQQPDVLAQMVLLLRNAQNPPILKGTQFGQSRVVYSIALDLAMCRLGAKCEADSWAYLRACGASGACADTDVVDAALRHLGLSSEATKEVEDISIRVVDSINQGNCSVFVPGQ